MGLLSNKGDDSNPCSGRPQLVLGRTGQWKLKFDQCAAWQHFATAELICVGWDRFAIFKSTQIIFFGELAVLLFAIAGHLNVD